MSTEIFGHIPAIFGVGLQSKKTSVGRTLDFTRQSRKRRRNAACRLRDSPGAAAQKASDLTSNEGGGVKRSVAINKRSLAELGHRRRRRRDGGIIFRAVIA